MHWTVSPACLLLALALLIAGFAVWAVDAPEPNAALHQAQADGDDRYRDALQSQLRARQLRRKVLLACLFGGSALLATTAFLAMPTSEGRARRS